ncbi:MAG: hypothetical protein H6587_01205 [Flavobacteriales bacterium]|nr:hypothetical protein [Flavobacteriales bacterium]MCB9363163.1 hypothetical protein [Flavobacteriales bacterium]
MKKFTTLLFLIVITVYSFGQTASENITKKWSLSELEEFGEKFALAEEQKNDWITFTADNKYSGTLSSEAIEGTWSEKGGKIYLSKGAASVFNVNWIKVITLEANSLVITYQSEDLIKTTLYYIPAE